MNRKVLVIDDDPVSVRLAEFSLGKQGYEITTASNGIEGLRKVQSDRPDLVIVDLLLPGLDGFEFCRRLRARSQSAWPRIVVISGKSRPEDKVTALRLGADDYLVKPAAPSRIVAVVDALLSQEAPRQEQPAEN